MRCVVEWGFVFCNHNINLGIDNYYLCLYLLFSISKTHHRLMCLSSKSLAHFWILSCFSCSSALSFGFVGFEAIFFFGLWASASIADWIIAYRFAFSAFLSPGRTPCWPLAKETRSRASAQLMFKYRDTSASMVFNFDVVVVAAGVLVVGFCTLLTVVAWTGAELFIGYALLWA